MPLIKPRTNRVRRVRHTCSLQEPTRDVLLQYARFIGDSPDYVLNALIQATLAKDRDFLAWQAQQGHGAPASPRGVEGVPGRTRNGVTA